MSFLNNIFGTAQIHKDISELIKNGAYLVDVREPGEFAGGSAKGAVNIPLGFLATQLQKLEGKGNIIVFCRSGNRSAQAKLILEQNGFKNVVNGGGIDQVIQQSS